MPRDRSESEKTTSRELSIGELEGWLWDAACSIRGPVDAPKFKDYILPLIFLKRLSDVFDDEVARLAEKFGDDETARDLVSEDQSLVRFYVPPGASWSSIRKLSTNLGQRLTEVVREMAKANPTLQGVIDIVDFNATVSGQRIIEDGRLSTLIETLSRHRLGLADVEPDLLGRATEYLLRKFAEGQGQSAGEFFTPREVGWLIARLLRPEEGMAVYDPACGSAGLLVKEQLVLRSEVKDVKRPLQLYGQELNHVTYAIARMNMIVHDMEGEVAIGDTLRTPKFTKASKLQTFDLVAANPMWNQPGYQGDFYDSDGYDRFQWGPPPDGTADWGWVQHILTTLNDKGRAVVVLDTGAVSRGSGGKGGGRELAIRRRLVDADLVEAVILLPENLFYNTSSAGLLLCLNRAKRASLQRRILLINASAEFRKGRPKNHLTDSGIDKIVDVFSRGEEAEMFATVIDAEIAAANDYNLLPSRFVDIAPPESALDLESAVGQLRDAERERADADKDLGEALRSLGVTTDSG